MSPAPPSDVRFELVRAADCDGEDLRRMLALLQSEHPRWPAASISVDPLDHLRWKSEGPGREGLAIRGFAGSELVALMLAFFSRAHLAGREVARNHLNDSTTSSAYQGSGLSGPRHRIFASSERGRTPHLEITRVENRLAQKVVAKRGFGVVACPIDVFLAVLDPRRFTADWLTRPLPGVASVLRAVGGTSGALRRLTSRGGRGQLEISTLKSFGAAEDALFERVAAAFDLIPDRHREFMNWRYLDRRGGDFVVRRARDGDVLLGYCVSRVSGGRGYVADLLTDRDRPDAAVALLRDAIETLRRQGASGVLAWAPRRHPHAASLKATGFVRSPRPVRLVYRLIGLPAELDVLAEPRARIHLAVGDTDEV